jgi:O-acetylhomoserine/O-acetylserine sulfhydrylase-like pyridoxal-dependent enzyme
MSSTEAPISITVKSAAGSLVTLRAETAEELDQRVALSIASLAAATQELEAAIRNVLAVNAAVPPNPQVASIATSFGGPETLVCHPATSTHVGLSQEALATMGVTDGLLRFSIGLEDADDLVDDIHRALAAI